MGVIDHNKINSSLDDHSHQDSVINGGNELDKFYFSREKFDNIKNQRKSPDGDELVKI